MATKLWLIALVFALVVVAESTSLDDATFGMTRLSSGDGDLPAMRISDDEVDLLDTESSRRQLAGRKRYISYNAMKRDRVPCNRRGQSYYYCRGNQRANPYRRGCTYITHCARDLS